MPCAKSAIEARAGLLVLAALGAAGCGVVRPSDFAPVCPVYATVVQPILTQRCAGCHGPGDDGGYRVGSYLQAIEASADDVARVVPGSADSGVLQAARGDTAPHVVLAAAELKTLTDWVVDCHGAPDPTQYHPVGWGSPLNGDQFHGAVLRGRAYATFECQGCHGQDLRGGKARVDCNGCHQQGPFACNTCHGDEASAAPPRALDGSRRRARLGVGAHRAHVTDNALHAGLACGACHPTITSAEDEGHYRFGSAFVTDRPVVLLPAPPGASGPAVWSREAATCANVACHAPNPLDTRAALTVPVWTSVGSGAATCGACHGLGPLGHRSTHCDGCHPAGYADGGVDLAVHLDGKVDLGAGTRCGVCHAPPGTDAFFDTHGQTDETVQTVGAHTAHLTSSTFRGPLKCQDCHVVPVSALAAGHVDLPPPAPVFPSGWSGGLARHDGTAPAYDPGTATCASVYCHGNGAFLVAADRSAGLVRAPRWTGGETQAFCGSCHGTPPLDGKLGHTIATSLGTCVQCHGLSVNPDGGIRFFPLPDGGLGSFHLDGLVNGNN